MMNRDTLRRHQGIAQLEQRDVGILGHQLFEEGLIRRQFALARGAPLRRRVSATARRDCTRPSRTRVLLSMIVALAADIGVLEGVAFDGVLKEGTVEPAVQDGFDRGDGAGADCQPAPAGRVDAARIVAPGQRQNPEAGAEALFRMGAVGHDLLAEGGNRGTELPGLGQHPRGRPGGMTPMR